MSVGVLHNRARSTLVRRSLRRIVPEPEQRLWYFLRGKRLSGHKFKRQYSVGRYVVDFYCAEHHLAIEIDGDSHYTKEGEVYDKQRTEYLHACGIRIVRFTNDEVMKNINGVVQSIASMLPSP